MPTTLVPGADDANVALVAKARATGNTVTELVTDSDDSQTTLRLYAPDTEGRVKIELHQSPKDDPAGVKRPLSIEAHGLNDTYHADAPKAHVTFYVEDNTGDFAHAIEWLWGEQWDNVMRVFTGLRVQGRVALGNTAPAPGFHCIVIAADPADRVLTVRGAPGQSAQLFRVESPTGAGLAYVDTDGAWNGPVKAGGVNARRGAVGFYGAAPTAKPVVTGSHSDGTASASLVQALAALGLVTDNTSA